LLRSFRIALRGEKWATGLEPVTVVGVFSLISAIN
jgi:hypothetical protein